MDSVCVIVDDGQVCVQYPEVEWENQFSWWNNVPDISSSSAESWDLPTYGVYGG